MQMCTKTHRYIYIHIYIRRWQSEICGSNYQKPPLPLRWHLISFAATMMMTMRQQCTSSKAHKKRKKQKQPTKWQETIDKRQEAASTRLIWQITFTQTLKYCRALQVWKKNKQKIKERQQSSAYCVDVVSWGWLVIATSLYSLALEALFIGWVHISDNALSKSGSVLRWQVIGKAKSLYLNVMKWNAYTLLVYIFKAVEIEVSHVETPSEFKYLPFSSVFSCFLFTNKSSSNKLVQNKTNFNYFENFVIKLFDVTESLV